MIVRLFVAAELPEEMLDALAETSARIRDEVVGRYVAPELFHVTLAFLGEVPGAHAYEVGELMRSGCHAQTVFQTSLGSLGIFGRSTSAMLWQGFVGGEAAWTALARGVRHALRGGGYALDEKSFIPHVTLMRRADVSRGVLPMPCIERGDIQRITLFSSDLRGSYPRYDALESYDLKAL